MYQNSFKMKQWTINEYKSAKIIIRVEHKMGRANIVSKELVLRPSRMEQNDYSNLLKIIETYGKTK